jgi:hypothetical protein
MLQGGHGLRQAEEGAVHQLQDLCGHTHVMLNDFRHLLYRRVRVSHGLQKGGVRTGKGRQFANGSNDPAKLGCGQQVLQDTHTLDRRLQFSSVARLGEKAVCHRNRTCR